MNWVRRTLFGTPIVNSHPPQSDDIQAEGKTSDTASGPGTSRIGSLSDGESEASSNGSRRSTASGPQHSERMVRKRRSLPRLTTSHPAGTLEPGRDDLRPHSQKASPEPEPRQVDSPSEPREAVLISSSPGPNVVDPVAPQIALEPRNPGPLSPGTQEAINEDVLPPAPPAFDELVSGGCVF